MFFFPVLNCLSPPGHLTFSKMTILDFQTERVCSRLMKMAESSPNNENSKYDESGRMFFKRVENTVEKSRNCSLQAISPFPIVFSKDLYRRHEKTRACLGKG